MTTGAHGFVALRPLTAMAENEGHMSWTPGLSAVTLRAMTASIQDSRPTAQVGYRSLTFVAAALFAGLLTIAYAWAPPPPGLSANGQDIIHWAQQQSDAVVVQVWLAMGAWVPGLAFFALMHQRLPTAHAAAYLMGVVTLLALLAIGMLIRLALSAHPDTLNPGVARTLASIDVYSGSIATFFVALPAGAVALAWRRARLPQWVAVISVVLAAEQLMESFNVFGTNGFFAPGGGLTQIGALIFGVWVLSQGIAVRRTIVSAAP